MIKTETQIKEVYSNEYKYTTLYCIITCHKISKYIHINIYLKWIFIGNAFPRVVLEFVKIII